MRLGIQDLSGRVRAEESTSRALATAITWAMA
jgi:hypothetical protein